MGSRVHEYKFHCPLKFVDLFLYLEVEKMLIYFSSNLQNQSRFLNQNE